MRERNHAFNLDPTDVTLDLETSGPQTRPRMSAHGELCKLDVRAQSSSPQGPNIEGGKGGQVKCAKKQASRLVLRAPFWRVHPAATRATLSSGSPASVPSTSASEWQPARTSAVCGGAAARDEGSASKGALSRQTKDSSTRPSIRRPTNNTTHQTAKQATQDPPQRVRLSG